MLFAILPKHIELGVDETLIRHFGSSIYGIGRHWDATRSKGPQKVFSRGHQWIVLCVLMPMPFAKRHWALPVMALLWLTQKQCKKSKRKHRTPAELAHSMVCMITHWFPQHSFSLSADYGFKAFAFEPLCTQRRVSFISRLRKDARMFDLPSQRKNTRGRPATTGKRLPTPKHIVEHKHKYAHQWKKAIFPWYANTSRPVLYWHRNVLIYPKRRTNPIQVLCLIVFDIKTNSFDVFFSTNNQYTPYHIVSLFINRWSIEVTFEEARAYLHIESTQNRNQKAVYRTVPLLLGLFSVVSFWYRQHSTSHVAHQEKWYTKKEPSFSDAIHAIRFDLWHCGIFHHSDKNAKEVKISHSLLAFVTETLARAA